MTRFAMLVSLLVGTSISSVQAGELVVHITGMQGKSGQIMVQLFDSETAWSEESSLRNAALDFKEGRATWTVADLPEGQYGIRSYHDKNSNNQLDTNFLGIPRERFGFSNNAKAGMGPPGWQAVRFSIDSAPREIEIGLQ